MQYSCLAARNHHIRSFRIMLGVLWLLLSGLGLPLVAEDAVPAMECVSVEKSVSTEGIASEKPEDDEKGQVSKKEAAPLCRTQNKKLAAMKSRKWLAVAARKEACAKQSESPEKAASCAEEAEFYRKKAAACAESAKW